MKINKLNSLKIIGIISLLLVLFSNKVLAQDYLDPTEDGNNMSITVIKNQERMSDTRYLISPGDVFSFSVYDEPTFTQPEIIVRPDGYATIEPLGELYVAGYDIKTLTGILYEKMSFYLKEPRISLNIKEFHPASIYIYGAVQKPGNYQQIIQANRIVSDSKNPTVKTDLTLSNVISNAGGITYDADLEHVTITSIDNKKREINLWKLIKDGDVTQNILLHSGDVVYVPRMETIPLGDDEFKLLISTPIFPVSFPVRVIGEVNKAGIFNISSETPYLNSAIALASGYTIDANKKFVKIYRNTPDGKISEIIVDPYRIDFVLRPNDLVDVEGRRTLKTVRAFSYINTILSPFAAAGSATNNWADVMDPGRRYRYWGY